MQLQFSTRAPLDNLLFGSPLLPARFWAKVNPFGQLPTHCPELSQCWVWTAYCRPDGYGQFRSYGRLVYTHRLSYAALVSPIPEGLHVLHHCDNPPCVRPGHLFAGTQVDNVADMIRKGRHWNSKLNDAKVLEIIRRASQGLTQPEIARQFGVSRSIVGQIVRREVWKHL
jgi:hypothetical protein